MRPFFFESETAEGIVFAYSFQALSLREAILLFNAYLLGVNSAGGNIKMTSATAYRRRGISYIELEI